MMRILIFALYCFSLSFSALTSASAQEASQTSRDEYRDKLNDNVIYLLGGQLGGGYIQLAHDVSVALKGEELRVIPLVGNAAVQNVRDVLFLRGIDLALTTVQALDLLQESGEPGTKSLASKIAYVAPLFPDEMHVIVGKNTNSISELAGKKVSFNNAGSQTALLSPAIFTALGIDVEAVNMPQGDAIEQIKSGELAATVCICPKPIAALPNITEKDGLKLIGVDYVPALEAKFLPGSITSEDYPNLIPEGQRIQTIATQTLLVTFNWSPGTARYRKVERFVEAFYLKFGELLKPPRSPLWRSVNLAGDVRGWKRFPAAQEMIDKQLVTGANTSASNDHIRELTARVAPGDLAEQERLFEEFMKWRANR